MFISSIRHPSCALGTVVQTCALPISLLSAARSELFNRVLAARVRDRSWNRGLEGEVWMLDGVRSVFGPEPWSEALAERLDRFDIHPAAPLWGRGALRTPCAVRRL